MSVIVKYTCNESGVVPTFNNGYVYEANETESNGIYTVEITSDILPTSINFISSSIIELIYLNISNITDFTDMFHDCNNLATVNTSDWDTSRVTSMSSMFNFCHRLTNIDVSNWDTSNVTNMNVMFSNCNALTELDVSNFDTSNVTDMQGMFYNCSNLISLDLSNFDTSKVTNMSEMFIFCKNLTSIGMLYSNKETVEKIQAALPNVDNLQRTIWVQDTDEKDYASNEYVIVKEYGFEKQKVRLPQPLRSIGNYKDKLYWDNKKGKYCIEQKVLKITADDLINNVYGSLNAGYDRTNVTNYGPGKNIRIRFTNSNLFYSFDIIGVYNNLFPFENNVYNVNVDQKEAVYTRYTGELVVCIDSGKLGLDFSTSPDYDTIFNSAKEWLKNSGLIMYAAIQPIIIETDITEKLNFDTYNESMYITIDELEAVPSSVSTVIAMKEMPLILSDWSNIGQFDFVAGNNSGYVNIDKLNKKIIFLNNRTLWYNSFIEIDTSHLSSVEGKTIKFVFDKSVSYYCGLFKAGTWYAPKDNNTESTELIYTFSDADRISHNSNIFRLQINGPYDEEIICTIQY